MKKIKFNSNKGITLIALIITVIILLILAGTAISISINGGDLFGKSQNAVAQYNNRVAEEENKIQDALNILDDIAPKDITIKMTLRKNNELEGTEVIITKSNYAEHLGKIVTKYTGAPTNVTIRSVRDETYNVSNVYRLYYIDWDNKYKDGFGTIYLKADTTSSTYPLKDWNSNVLDGAAETSDKSKMKNLNPSLFVDGVIPPATSNENMSAVRWLTDTDKWKTLIIPSFSEKTNYIVGAPSLEMMMDSYNTHYGLTGSNPDQSEIVSGTRRKLFYKYPAPAGLNNYGYVIGPGESYGSASGYNYGGMTRTVETDADINCMYYPDVGNYYCLASPSGRDSESLTYVYNSSDGVVSCGYYSRYSAFCPLVSLKSDVQL